MNRHDVQRMRAAKRDIEPNPFAHSFRARRRFRSNWRPADLALLAAMRRNPAIARASRHHPDRVREKARGEGVRMRIVDAYLSRPWKRRARDARLAK